MSANARPASGSVLEALEANPVYQQQRELFEAMEGLCANGIDADTFPNGVGPFGLVASNPVPTRTVFGSVAYLGRLRATDGTKVKYERLGSVSSPVSEMPVDQYDVRHRDGLHLAHLFLSPYQQRISGKAPLGFTLAEHSFAAGPRPGQSKSGAGASRVVGRFAGKALVWAIRNFWVLLVLGFVVWLLSQEKPKPPQPPPPVRAQAAPSVPAPKPAPPAYVRPATDPNGAPWPVRSSYVAGFSRLNTKGLSQVTIDNTQNSSDAFAKLYAIDGGVSVPVRTVFIAARESFTLDKVSPGAYDVRYRDLDTGGLARSDPFTLEQIREADGTRYSTVRMTLYKVKNGNMKTYELAESDF